MSYVVLARKWRPMTFEDLVGQSHVSRTLHNAIASGRVAHAFLFTGVRGVGKTTAARILAKALNCMGPDGAADGPTATPCLACPACREIAAGTDVDVREIDGASYNGVDEVRKLQDSLPYRPTRDRSKVIIVDEVHMLSQSAWNAFLKTLEEPPPHVKFIFATTEVHKVPVTILSRVQRFDFKLIPTQLIAARLRHVLEQEGIAADDQALSIVAREAAGSMRDAMSLMDQVIAWNDEKLDGESVSRVLGVASRKVLHDLAASLVRGEPSDCLRVVSDLSNQGFDMATVARDILALLRDLVVAKVCPEPGDLLDLADEERADVQSLAEHTDPDDLVRLHQAFSTSFDDVVRSSQPRAALEMLLVRLARRPPLLPIDDLIGRLSALERRLGGAPPGPGGVGGTGGAARKGSPAPRRPPPRDARASGAFQRHESGDRSGSAPALPSPGADDTTRPGATSPIRTPPTESRPAGSCRDVADDAPNDAALRPGRSSPVVADDAASASPPRDGPSKLAAPLDASTKASRPAPPSAPRAAQGVPAPRSRPSSPSPTFDRWRAVVGRVATDYPDVAACLTHASPVSFDDVELVVAVETGSVFERRVTSPETRQALEAAASAEVGDPVSVRFEQVTKAGETISAVNHRERSEERREAIERARTHPFVQQVETLLGARLKEIRIPEE